jgi:hypothetical protein
MFPHYDLPALAVNASTAHAALCALRDPGGKTKGISPNKLLPDKIKIFAG